MGKGQHQHYFSKWLLKQWANDAEEGHIEVLCMVHREIGNVAPKSIHWNYGLVSSEQELSWSHDIEHPAKNVFDHLQEQLLSVEEHNRKDIEEWLRERASSDQRRHYEILIDLARLHHARSLVVPLKHLLQGAGEYDPNKTAAAIDARWQRTERWLKLGLCISLLPDTTPVHLGAIPLLDWDGRKRPKDDAAYIMPLTPRIMISNHSSAPTSSVEVVDAQKTKASAMLDWQLAGRRDLCRTPFLMCLPGQAEQIKKNVLERTAGEIWHWWGLERRVELAIERARNMQDAWQKHLARQKFLVNRLANNKSMPQKKRREYGNELKERALCLQASLDECGVPVCGCGRFVKNSLRGKALWERLMPSAICAAVKQTARQ